MGGRPLGLGRAYTGVADDVYSIFQNPAGISRIKHLQAASLYAKVIEEVDYSSISIVNSLSRESVGLGYVRAGVGGGVVTKRDPVTDRVVPDSNQAIGYDSTVWLASYGVAAGKYLPYPVLKDLYLGTNFKLFSQSLTGIPSRDAKAQGFDMDLGISYLPVSWLTIGAAGYNVLSYDMGGKLVWDTGITESIPASAKVGCAIKLIGVGGLREFLFYPQELLLSYDYEFAFKQGRLPQNHLGIEWSPLENLSVRLGLDQDDVATGDGGIGIDNNLTAGLGFNLFNLQLDYAFHTFGSLSANNTHFFSLSWGLKKENFPTWVAPPKPKAYLEIAEPAEKFVTFNPYVILKGSVSDLKAVRDVKIGESKVNLFPDRTFFSVVKLPNFGRNTLEIDALNETGRIIETKYLTVILLPSFVDVPEDNPLRNVIGSLAARGYVSGFSDGSFRPGGAVSRAELTALLTRIKTSEEVTVPSRSPFKDVSRKHWASRYIAFAVKAGWMRGYQDGTFKPSNKLSRAEAVSILSKFAGLEEPKYVYEKPFPDVNVKHWAARSIYAAKNKGLLDYLAGKKFEPNRKLTRGEMAEILGRVDLVAEKLRELVN